MAGRLRDGARACDRGPARAVTAGRSGQGDRHLATKLPAIAAFALGAWAVALGANAADTGDEGSPQSREIGSLFTRGLAPLDLGRTLTADQDAQTCRDCHTAIWEEWQQSQHGQAWTNGIFQREFRTQPLDWCVRCHAPLAVGGADSVGPIPAQGVSCAVCHIRDGKMLASSKRAGSPHDTEVVAGLETAEYCGGCHQFNFPIVTPEKQVNAYTSHPMQDTVAEFHAGARSGQAGQCMGCHGNTPAGHRFPGAHAEGVLEHALSMTVCKAGSEVEVALTNRGAGHNVPTGDLHRHLLLRVWKSTAPERLYEARIGRLFEAAPDGGKVVSEDTSIRPSETRRWRVPVRALGGGAEPINMDLRYVYTVDERPLAANDPGEPTAVVVLAKRAALAELERCP
ncbi:MAG: hypothetical protein EXR69_08380 [Myxococcales bacterium]|nr:hypothetical protein [Myxococcales bacterium]